MSINLRVNDRIRINEVRVISETGEQVGIMATEDARKLAEDRGLDLVEVSPEARPPVCKILDYGKYKYDSEKKEKSARKKTHVIVTKEIKIRPKIDIHDFGIKMRRVREFLEEGNRVKVTIMYRGREMSHKEMGTVLIQKVVAEFEKVANVDQVPEFEGRNLSMVLAPKHAAKPKPTVKSMTKTEAKVKARAKVDAVTVAEKKTVNEILLQKNMEEV